MRVIEQPSSAGPKSLWVFWTLIFYNTKMLFFNDFEDAKLYAATNEKKFINTHQYMLQWML